MAKGGERLVIRYEFNARINHYNVLVGRLTFKSSSTILRAEIRQRMRNGGIFSLLQAIIKVVTSSDSCNHMQRPCPDSLLTRSPIDNKTLKCMPELN